MSKILMIISTIVIAAHGLIHLMGTVTYMKLGTVEGLSYKTTVLNGALDLGARGIAVFGALWAVAALGFIAAAAALLFGWEWGQTALVVVALFSLVLTAMDWDSARFGAITNLVILAAIWFGPQVTSLFDR